MKATTIWENQRAISQTFRLLVMLAAILAAQTAGASFHLWRISELYSNATGTIQYVVLQDSEDGEEFLGGHAITAAQGGNSHTYSFPNDLPGDATGGHSFLIGTQGFANLGIVSPDYVVANGFLFLAGGSVNYADVDSVTYSAFPADGIHALDRNGRTTATAPTNFAGATGAIVDCVFNWAERSYPQYFSPARPASATSAPYYFRFYSGTGNYLGTSSVDDHLWGLGPITGNIPLDIGPVTNFLTMAGCADPAGTPAAIYPETAPVTPPGPFYP